MRNIKLTIAYDGTCYNGWQRQNKVKTIQGEIENVMMRVFEKKHNLYGAGRTDAGVHARAQVANFKTDSTIPTEKILKAINSLLPTDIAILKAEEKDSSFHSQYNAKQKFYRYQIFNSQNRDPFKESYFWRIGYNLDFSLMRKETECLIGQHDFKSFKASEKIAKHTVRNVNSLEITKNKNDIFIDIKGDGFLYNMVRNIVGTLVEIGRGYLPKESMKNILSMKDRNQAGQTAPAKGLFLMDVTY